MATSLSDLHVDPAAIEKQLSELWRAEKQGGEKPITKAALWNVVAHTWTADQHAHASEVLARASASVPQRTIAVRADPSGDPSIASWISANCHMVGGGRQVCSEEISILAAGEHIDHVPPLVSALLLPDMPVAVWWLGDLPRDHHQYAETLLEPADRLIFDSAHFLGRDDLDLVSRIADNSTTAPADLNWGRIEEWRAATAALFDPPSMRARLHAIRGVRAVSGGGATFGELAEGLLFVSWLTAQIEREVPFELTNEGSESGIVAIDIQFDDGLQSSLRGDRERGVVISSGGTESALDSVTRSLARKPEDLIVRLLKKPEADRVYLEALKVARQLAK